MKQALAEAQSTLTNGGLADQRWDRTIAWFVEQATMDTVIIGTSPTASDHRPQLERSLLPDLADRYTMPATTATLLSYSFHGNVLHPWAMA
nr:hypothetical protein CFP56_57647 [Quercus suber]